ncbi:MAG: AMP-binding protein [Planctomycetes bacterium]|nr:AMP-binding protein [Planctomycetota bacterium]
MPESLNIAERLREVARRYPHQRAVVCPVGRARAGRVAYAQLTFEQLDQETDRLARGLSRLGVEPGMRLVLMVRPSLEFVTLTFALFKAGVVIVLIDPGMGRSNVFRCLEEVEPDGFVAIPLVHAVRVVSRRRFPQAKVNVTVGGRRWGWGGVTYEQLLGEAWTPYESVRTLPDDPAAIIFTSGSTGPPKGVLYLHSIFDAQVDLLREFFHIQPGEVSLSAFPLFSLFDAAMGVTTIIPDMDPTRPARVDPEKILQAIRDHGVTQAFGSPAMWNRISRHCEQSEQTIPCLRRVISAGAPVPIRLIERMLGVLEREDADIYTPYGATESLPVACISGRDVLKETAELSRKGAGTCVGRVFPGITVRIIPIVDGPIRTIDDVQELPPGQIGEIIVQGPVVTPQYVRKPEATAEAKIADPAGLWHRMGDVGYRDQQGRLWFCGRKAHIVHTDSGPLFPVPCEAIFNEHSNVYRSALVGVGPKGKQRPVIVVEPEPGYFPRTHQQREEFTEQLLKRAAAEPLTQSIRTVLFHPSLPVDVRHNVKIGREQLSVWAERELAASD